MSGKFEALRSISLFNLNGVPNDNYIDGVEHQVRNVQPNCPEILFRYYISGEMWEVVAKRGLIRLPGVEFVKMRHSSKHSRIGTFWRFMGLNDNRFEIVFTSDVEGYEFNLTMETLRTLIKNRDKPIDLCGSILFLREEMDYLKEGSQEDELQIFNYTDLHGDGIFIQPISSLNRFSGKDIIRGGGNPLPELVPLICEYLASTPQQRIYHPRTNQWTVFQECEPRLGAGQYGFMNEFFFRFLTKVVPMRMTILKNRYAPLVRIFQRYGEECLLRRLYHQLSAEGHEIVSLQHEDFARMSKWSTIEDNPDLEKPCISPNTKVAGDRSKSFKPLVFKDPEGSQAAVNKIVETIRTDNDSVWVWFDERIALYELARGYHNKPETQGYILEFGSHRGASACIMGTGVRDSGTTFKPVFTLDPYFYNGDDLNHFNTQSYLQARAAYAKTGLANNYVCPMIFNDLELLKFWNLPTRLIFIDTSHQYEHTKQEIEQAISHVMDDGWLVLHDYCDKSWGQEVIRALNEFLDEQIEYDLDVYFVKGSLVCIHVNGRKVNAKGHHK